MRLKVQPFNTLISAATISIALLLSLGAAIADTSVWKVSKGGSHIFLGGTVHMLSQSDYPLPAEFDEAYNASDVVVFETDIAALSEPEIAQLMMMKMSYTDGSTLRDHLTVDTIDALESHLKQRGVNLDQFATFKPSMLYVVLTMIELQIIGIDAEGVDAHYSTKAANDNKAQMMLETPQEQIDFLAAIGIDDPDKMLEYTLRDLASLESMMDTLLSAWREGDPEVLADQLVDIMAADYPEMYTSLLVNRNYDWLPQLTQYFETKDVEFVMVGAAHLVGDVGLLSLLRADGYKIEQL